MPRQEWAAACKEFHERCDELAFPGGYGEALSARECSDAGAVDLALCSVELRPYFFRSRYMYTLLMRRLKRCAMTSEQAARSAAVVERAAAGRQKERESSRAN
jgi:hypothetical protein